MLILGYKSGWVILRRLSKLKLIFTHPLDFLPICYCWIFPQSAPYPYIHEQVTSLLFGEYDWFKCVIGIHIRLIYVWHYKKLYSSFTLNTIYPHPGPFKTSRFEGLFAIINSCSTNKADMHCSHPIFRTFGCSFKRWFRCNNRKPY